MKNLTKWFCLSALFVALGLALVPMPSASAKEKNKATLGYGKNTPFIGDVKISGVYADVGPDKILTVTIEGKEGERSVRVILQAPSAFTATAPCPMHSFASNSKKRAAASISLRDKGNIELYQTQDSKDKEFDTDGKGTGSLFPFYADEKRAEGGFSFTAFRVIDGKKESVTVKGSFNVRLD